VGDIISTRRFMPGGRASALCAPPYHDHDTIRTVRREKRVLLERNFARGVAGCAHGGVLKVAVSTWPNAKGAPFNSMTPRTSDRAATTIARDTG
jgi:hypothetical protein